VIVETSLRIDSGNVRWIKDKLDPLLDLTEFQRQIGADRAGTGRRQREDKADEHRKSSLETVERRSNFGSSGAAGRYRRSVLVHGDPP
jgi:hypothetical protein